MNRFLYFGFVLARASCMDVSFTAAQRAGRGSGVGRQATYDFNPRRVELRGDGLAGLLALRNAFWAAR
jgi:hypothetical protein